MDKKKIFELYRELVAAIYAEARRENREVESGELSHAFNVALHAYDIWEELEGTIQ